ncbi:MAG: sulfatase-like hydrolase/transferase [Melioribacteraceae bacterium]|nr:sulfatase-like hydrolase/transferase [Melioribacteraceae bacterium]
MFDRLQIKIKYFFVIISCTIALSITAYSQQKVDKPNKPNVVIFIADDLGWNDVGYHGSEINTPTMDRLAKEGVEFDQFYVYPTCSPTRAALLTGRAPSRFGVLTPIQPYSEVPKNKVTLAELFQQGNYETAITGKWHLGTVPEKYPSQYGFNYSYGSLHGQIDQYTHIYKEGDTTWHRNDKFIVEAGHATDLIADEAIKYITKIRDKSNPFFLYVSFTVPHYPLQEEDKWSKPYDGKIENQSRKIYAASVTHMDEAINKVVASLENENIIDNTLIIFISDNGGQKSWFPKRKLYNGEHGPNDRLGDNAPLKGWKSQLYEGGIRVPAIFYWKNNFTPRKISEAVSIIDIYPTLAALIGEDVPAKSEVEGINILPVIDGKQIDNNRTFYWRTPTQLAVRKNDWKLVRTGDIDSGKDELFNIAKDPNERTEVSDENQDILTQLKQELTEQYDLDSVVINNKKHKIYKHN